MANALAPPRPTNALAAPLKYTDIKKMLRRQVDNLTPEALEFFLGSQIPPTQPGIDPRQIPFNDVSPELRDQRQRQFLNPGQNTPFSIAGGAARVRQNANTPK